MQISLKSPYQTKDSALEQNRRHKLNLEDFVAQLNALIASYPDLSSSAQKDLSNVLNSDFLQKGISAGLATHEELLQKTISFATLENGKTYLVKANQDGTKTYWEFDSSLLAKKDLSNVTDADFKAKATSAGVGNGGTSSSDSIVKDFTIKHLLTLIPNATQPQLEAKLIELMKKMRIGESAITDIDTGTDSTIPLFGEIFATNGNGNDETATQWAIFHNLPNNNNAIALNENNTLDFSIQPIPGFQPITPFDLTTEDITQGSTTIKLNEYKPKQDNIVNYGYHSSIDDMVGITYRTINDNGDVEITFTSSAGDGTNKFWVSLNQIVDVTLKERGQSISSGIVKDHVSEINLSTMFPPKLLISENGGTHVKYITFVSPTIIKCGEEDVTNLQLNSTTSLVIAKPYVK